MIENIRLSFQGIWSHKMRSLLTMLGIIIGIASIISIVSTIRGTNEQIKQNLIGNGSNIIKIQLYQKDQTDYIYDIAGMGLPDGIPPISSDTVKQLESMKDVEAVSVYTRRNDYSNSLYYRNTYLQGCEVFGAKNDYFDTTGYEIISGRGFVPKDFSDYRHVMIIDNNVASSLFYGEDPLGQTVEYMSQAFVIIGVVEDMNRFEPVIETPEDYYNYLYEPSAGKLFVPSTVWPDIYAYDEPEEVSILCRTTESMAVIGKDAADLLNTYNTNEEIVYKGDNLLQKAKDLQNLSDTTNRQLIWIASISLLVGGIGVMNIMLVSVTERTREIGIKKAIGAKKRLILGQFLTEAAVLTCIGGVIGVIAGIGVSFGISSFTSIPFALSIPSILIAVIFSMVIGIVFGLLPSVKAANLNPIEALRHE